MFSGRVVKSVSSGVTETIIYFMDGTILKVRHSFGTNKYLEFNPESQRWTEVHPGNFRND